MGLTQSLFKGLHLKYQLLVGFHRYTGHHRLFSTSKGTASSTWRNFSSDVVAKVNTSIW
jgi:hypothetical protein